MCNRTYWPFRKKYWGICSDLEGFSLMSACPKFLEEDPKLSGNFMAISARTGLKIPFQYSWRYLLLYPGSHCKFDCYFLSVFLWVSLQVPWFPSERVPKVFGGAALQLRVIYWEVLSLTSVMVFPWQIRYCGVVLPSLWQYFFLLQYLLSSCMSRIYLNRGNQKSCYYCS